MRTVAATRADVLPSKTCTKCEKSKLLLEFYHDPRASDGRWSCCKSCERLRSRDYSASYRLSNRDKALIGKRLFRSRLRLEVILAYGGQCTCCGEARLYFLCVDHVHGDGAAERRKAGHHGGHSTYRWLKKEGYPKDGRYQVLCYNCNGAKGTGAECPCRQADTIPVLKGQGTLF